MLDGDKSVYRIGDTILAGSGLISLAVAGAAGLYPVLFIAIPLAGFFVFIGVINLLGRR